MEINFLLFFWKEFFFRTVKESFLQALKVFLVSALVFQLLALSKRLTSEYLLLEFKLMFQKTTVKLFCTVNKGVLLNLIAFKNKFLVGRLAHLPTIIIKNPIQEEEVEPHE